MAKLPQLNMICEVSSVETSKILIIRSPLTFKNSTSISLSLLLTLPSVVSSGSYPVMTSFSSIVKAGESYSIPFQFLSGGQIKICPIPSQVI